MGLTRSKRSIVVAAPMIWPAPVAWPMTTESRYAVPWTPPIPYPTLKFERILHNLSGQPRIWRYNGARTLLCWDLGRMDSRPRPIE